MIAIDDTVWEVHREGEPLAANLVGYGVALSLRFTRTENGWEGAPTPATEPAFNAWLAQFDNQANVAAAIMRKAGDAVAEYLRKENARR